MLTEASSLHLTKAFFFVTAFYCRDPDTGKFYPVNTTWSSTTFCGSYTCKVRKLNYTVHSSPIREINIADAGPKRAKNESAMLQLIVVNRTQDKVLSEARGFNKTQTNLYENRTNTSPDSVTINHLELQDSSKENLENKITNFKKKMESLEVTQDDNNRSTVNETQPIVVYTDKQEHLSNITHNKKYEILFDSPTVETQRESVKEMMAQKNSKESNVIKKTEPQKVSMSKDDDRYLTADEIKALINLLQNVKKSDVEAILEVYNLAQDIYKEIDKSTDHNIGEDLHNIHGKEKDSKPEESIKREPNDHISYWYEPLSHSNNKQKIVQIDTSKLVPVIPPDSRKETHTVPVPPIVMEKPMGPITNSNFRKLPYYYPVLGMHKQSSYDPGQEYIQRIAEPPEKTNSIKTPPIMISQTGLNADFPVTKKSFIKVPCKQEHFKHTTGEEMFTKKTTMAKDKISFMDDPKTLLAPFTRMYKKSPTVLPYPFAYVHYNLSAIPSTYFNANPFHLFNIKPQEPVNKKNPILSQPHVNPKYLSGLPNAILVNPDLSGEVDIIEQKPVEVILTQEDKMPFWQTASLSQSVLNEVKANVLTQSKILPIPIRKKVKIERVSKAMNMDELKRPIRDTMSRDFDLGKEVPEEFEVYLENST